MAYSLSPEQKVAVDALLGQSSSDIKYFDLTTAFQSAFHVILESINEQKKVLIHLPSDMEHSKEVLTLINLYGLEGLSISLDKTNAIPESDLVTLRSVVKKDPDTKPIIENTFAKENLKSALSKTKQYYNALDTSILNNNTFRNFAASTILKGNQKKSVLAIDHRTDVLGLELTAQEFYKIKREINNASESYLREFDLFDQINIINDDVWGYDIDKIEETRQTLEILNTESKELVSAYTITLAALQQDAASDITNNISQLLTTIKTNQQECTSYHINETYKKPTSGNKFSLFSKKEKVSSNAIFVSSFDAVSKLINDISSDWYEDLPAPQTEEINYNYISKFLSKCLEDAPHYTQKINLSLTNSIHRINRINTSSDAVISLDKKLIDLVTRIGKIGIIQHEFNTNTISFTKQIAMSKQISEVLDQCCNLIGKESSYTKWKTQEKSNGEITNLLISELKSLPVNQWNTQFELWYNEQIKTSIISDLTIDKSRIEHLRFLNESVIVSDVLATTNKLQLVRINAVNKLKSTSKELYNALFKKKSLTTYSWNDIALTARPFLQDFFPIHTNTELAEIDKYDIVISFNRRPENGTAASPIHYLSPIIPEDIEEMGESNDIFLYLNDYNYNAPLEELSNTEKLKAAKKLAKFILSLNQQVKIYQIKTGNIISLLPSNDDAQFESKMDQHGIKSIETSGALYDKLTESILFTNRQPYLLIKDELINPELHQHILWQADTLETFKTAGYKILSLNTDKQLIDNDLAFQLILEPLTEDNKIEDKSDVEDITPNTPTQELETPAEL